MYMLERKEPKPIRAIGKDLKKWSRFNPAPTKREGW